MRTVLNFETKESLQAAGDLSSVGPFTVSLAVSRDLPWRHVYLGLLVMGNNLVRYNVKLRRFDDSSGQAALGPEIVFRENFGDANAVLNANGITALLPQQIVVYDLPPALASTDSPPQEPFEMENQFNLKRQFVDSTSVLRRDYFLKLFPVKLHEQCTRLEMEFTLVGLLDTGFAEGKWVAVLGCKSSGEKI